MSSEHLIYYDNYQEIYTRPAGYFDYLAKEILKFSEERGKIRLLDIGCGFGDFLASFYKILREKAEYHGLTIAKHEFDSIRKNYPFINIKLGKQQDLLKIFGEQKFDIIINFHTLSYIPQELQLDAIKQIILKLKENGLLVFAFMEDWIKISSNISQGGEGFVQFYHSPFTYFLLDRYSSLIFSKKSRSYRIHFWKKTKKKKIGIRGFLLSIFYIIRNNFLFINYLSKLIKKII